MTLVAAYVSTYMTSHNTVAVNTIGYVS